ncbi:EamA family transporter [Corallococcus sp. H22C18031201]|uniref:DMT family transporter n=1 Tax=Citreicoccus inhibens TaxID=2849499 RepID=UPI000E76A41F|nr:EamA family transporter [Citreicoccus inhibens]MBU8897551.1 EamA family transporter [Citreicoccus inhibens]RJS19236.1 EamA family transporter [Corallococcus sp. H22C18031201]
MRSFATVASGAILWGCWPLFLHSTSLSGEQIALLALFAMSLPAPFLLRREPLRDRRATLALAAVGLADAGNAALFFAAVQRGPVAVAVLSHYLAPLLVALAAPWVLREPRSVRAVVAGPATLLGLGLLILRPGGGFSATTAALGAGSALFYGVIILGGKEAARAWSPLAVTSLHAPLSMVTLLLCFGRGALPPALDVNVACVLAGGLMCGLGGNLLFNAGLRRVPTAAAGALTYLEPLTAALIGWAFFQEALTPWGVAGGALVLAAGVWVAAGSREPSTSPAPATAP